MRRMLLPALVALTGALVGAGICRLTFDPRLHLDDPQRAILAEYLAVYCGGSQGDKAFFLGEAAAMSRLTIRAGIGAYAYSQYLKCRR